MKTILSSRRGRHLARFGISLITVALIAGLVGCGTPAEEEEEEEEQEIQTWYDLHAIRNDLGGTYFLGNNLDSTTPGYQELASETANTGKGWEPIGTADDRFTGTFDGGGHSITGLHISRPDEDDVGLFGYVEEGVIKNIGLMEADVTGGNQTGALVGYNWGGTVESDPIQPYSTYSTGSVTGSDKVGGLVGYNWGGIVSLSQSSAHVAHVTGETWRAGGLVGSNWGDVLLCIYRGSVTGDHEVGGLVGLNGDLIPGGMGGRVVSCYGEYTVTGNWFVGGAAGVNLGSLDNIALNFSVNGHYLDGDSLMALNTDTTIDGDSSDTAPQGSYVGGLAGLNKGSVNNCVTVGIVTGYQYIGGLVGYNDPDGVIASSFAATGVEGSLDFGGLIGYNDAGATVTNSFWDSEASDTNTGVGTGDAAGITSKSSQEMKDINSYIAAGWDICAVTPGESNTACTWNMVPGETYPFLSGKQPDQYNLTISSTEGGGVTTPGGGTFTHDEGTVVNLVAEADEGYHFVNWAGDVGTMGDVNSAVTTITILDDYSITANFARQPDYTITDPLGDLYGEGGYPASGPDWQDITDIEITRTDETIRFIFTVSDEFPDIGIFEDGAIMLLVDIDGDGPVVPSEGLIDFCEGNFDYGIFIPSPEFAEPPIFIEDLRLQGDGVYDTTGAKYNIDAENIEIEVELEHIGAPQAIRFVGAIRTGIASYPIEDRVPNEGLAQLSDR